MKNIINKILKPRFLPLLFLPLLLSGCYSSLLSNEKITSKTDLGLISKIDLKDGTTVDFYDSRSYNKLLTFDDKEVTYRNRNGNTYSVQTGDISQIYFRTLIAWKSVIVIIGAVTAIITLLGPYFSGKAF